MSVYFKTTVKVKMKRILDGCKQFSLIVVVYFKGNSLSTQKASEAFEIANSTNMIWKNRQEIPIMSMSEKVAIVKTKIEARLLKSNPWCCNIPTLKLWSVISMSTLRNSYDFQSQSNQKLCDQQLSPKTVFFGPGCLDIGTDFIPTSNFQYFTSRSNKLQLASLEIFMLYMDILLSWNEKT